ncbi:hypothetical protein C7M84_008509 [Penaeus vannamei]|uniref:Uncharacterized protein n=1 Tax=Penaeus vannamei TaxID=6689 RepID=A0A3R7M660_PENVA|nr:hypothetical protein C7M84_008509 [Penaeus vannamei]
MEALSLDPYFEKAHDTLEVILPLLKALFAEGIFFSSFPDKIGDVIGSRYKRPGNINLLPTELALACQWVPYADEFFLQEPAPRERDSSPSRRHERRDSRSPDGRHRRPDHGRPAGSPRRLTPRPSCSRYSRTACSPARSPSRPSARPSPRRPRDASPTRDLADAWMPPRARALVASAAATELRIAATLPFAHSTAWRGIDVYVTTFRTLGTPSCGAPLLPIRGGRYDLLAFLDSGSALSILPASSSSKYKHPFVVTDGPGDILLGHDFMVRTGLYQTPQGKSPSTLPQARQRLAVSPQSRGRATLSSSPCAHVRGPPAPMSPLAHPRPASHSASHPAIESCSPTGTSTPPACSIDTTHPFLLTLPSLHLLYFFSITHVSINCGSNHSDREVSGASSSLALSPPSSASLRCCTRRLCCPSIPPNSIYLRC